MSVAHRQGLSLKLHRRFEAPPAQVFEAWTDADLLKQWFGPPGWRVESAWIDLRPGGELRLDLLQEASGSLLPIRGAFRTIEPPCRLSCTWNVITAEGQVCETLLSVQFLPQGQGTMLQLRQDLLADARTREQQRQLMECCLKQLEGVLG